MKYNEIIKLLDAGYSREEILAMKEEPAPAPDPEPTPNDPEPTPNDPEPAPAPDPAADVMKEMKEMFAEMKKELIAMNILNSRQESDDVKTGEDVLANIINPTMRKNGGN